MMKNFLMMYGQADDGVCSCDCCGHDHEHDHDCQSAEDDVIIQLVDPESGEEYEFIQADMFDFEDQEYCVLVTTDTEEDPQYLIARVVEEDGEAYVESLAEEEEDAVYEAYEKLLEEEFGEED